MKAASLLIWSIIILVVAIVIGIEIQQDPGYVLIHINDYVIETSFWAIVAVVAMLFIVVYTLVRVVTHFFNISMHYSRWRDKINVNKALRLTNLGYMNFSCGDWRAAEKNFIGAAGNHELRLSSYLLAARAAHAQGEYDRRDKYLNKAYALDKNDQGAVLLTAAQLQVGASQWQQADASLAQLSSRQQRSELALRLSSKVAVETKNWQQLQSMLPKLRKKGALPAAQVESIEEQVYVQQLSAARANIAEVISLWKDLPRQWRQNVNLLTLYISILIEHEYFDDAAPLLQAAINLNWDASLIKLYGNLVTNDPKRQLKQAVKWLKDHPSDMQLLLTLAQLSFSLQLWGQCKDYCEDSIAAQPSAHAYKLLGAALEELDQPDAAMECYRKGLDLESPLKHL